MKSTLSTIGFRGALTVVTGVLVGCSQNYSIEGSRVLASAPAGSVSAGQHSALVAVNDGPYEVAQNQNLIIPIADLIANDVDSNHLVISFVSYQNLDGGTLSRSGNTLSYQPALDYIGPVTFNYTITNSEGTRASAKVSIFVRRPATEVMYGHTFNELYSYDPHTHENSLIASFHREGGGSPSITDIAITSNGVMYGVDGSGLNNIDATTGLVSRIETTGIEAFGNINGLTALWDGRIVISGNGVAIYNVVTHTLSTLVAPGQYQSSGDILALPDGYLYLVAYGSASDLLVKINPNTGATVEIGSLHHAGVYGIGYAYNTLYGFAWDGQIFEINPATAATQNPYSSSQNWAGATTNPVLW